MRVHRSDKSITSPRYGLHKPGVFSGISEGFADFVNSLVEALIEVYKRVGGPDFLPQLFPSDDLSRTIEQGANDLERLVLELDLDTALPQLTVAQSISNRPNCSLRESGAVISKINLAPWLVHYQLPTWE